MICPNCKQEVKKLFGNPVTTGPEELCLICYAKIVMGKKV